MKIRILSRLLLCCVVTLAACVTHPSAYDDARSFNIVIDDDSSKPREYLFGFINDQDPVRDPDESQIVIWRTNNPMGQLTLHGVRGYTHYRGIELYELGKAGTGVFTLSQNGAPRRLAVDGDVYQSMQQLIRTGQVEEFLKLVEREQLLGQLDRHEI